MVNKVNFSLCEGCKHFYADSLRKGENVYNCMQVPFAKEYWDDIKDDGITTNKKWDMIIARKKSTEFDIEFNSKFLLPSNCPYILEHTVTSE